MDKPKYNFHELREAIYKGGSLPVDVNQPVKDYLAEIGAFRAVEALEQKESRVQCGKIVTYMAESPLRRIEIKTNYGMVEGFDIVKEQMFNTGFSVIDYTHVKNENLSMKDERKKK